MTINRRKLCEWVARRTLTPPMATAFKLFHVARHGVALVAEIPLSGGAEDWPEHVARACHEEATGHVDGWPGRQQYIVRAYVEGNDEPVGEFPFGLAAQGEASTAELAQATPDYQAAMAGQIPLQDFSHPHAQVMAQQMRHNEALIRFLVDVTMHSRDRDGAIINRQQSHIDKLEADRFRIVEMTEDMLSRKQERAIKQERWETDKQRKEQLMAKLLQFVIPEAARRFGMTSTLSENQQQGAEELDEIKQLFLKLPAEMQNEIVNQLPEEDSDRLLSIFEGRSTKH